MELFHNDWDEVLKDVVNTKEFYNTMVLAKKEYEIDFKNIVCAKRSEITEVV